MRKKWLKGMAALLSAAVLTTMPGLPARADTVADSESTETSGSAEMTGSTEVIKSAEMTEAKEVIWSAESAEMAGTPEVIWSAEMTEPTEDVEQVVRSVSGGDADILYPAPVMEWVDIWSLRLGQPEGFVPEGEGHEYKFQIDMSKDGVGIGSWTSGFSAEVELPVYFDLPESGTYTYVGYIAENGRQVSETVTLEREYTAPTDKLGTTVATWHDGSMPQISFPEIPHAEYYLILVVKDGTEHGGPYFPASYFERHEDGTLWTNEHQIQDILSHGSGEYQVRIRAISENVMLYANGDEGGLSETYAFDGIFGKVSTSDFSEVKTGLANEKVTDIEYILPDGAKVSEADQAELFSALQGTDKSLTFSFRDESQSLGYQWTFDGTEIVDAAKAMQFQIIVDANVQDVIACVDTSQLNEVDLAFLHEGELPGRATVTINLQGKLGEAKTAHLYYYNPETKQLEVVAENLAIEGGYVAFPMSHCSNYILTAEMLKNLIPDREPEKSDPKPNTNSNTTDNTVSAQPEVNVEPVSASFISYVVEPGDTLKKIAAKFYGSREFWTKIFADNAGIISNPDRIYIGQVLYIYLTDNPVEAIENMAEGFYTVQPGDSLWKIAKKLYCKGTLYSKIYEANKNTISNPKSLYVGQKIVVPQ